MTVNTHRLPPWFKQRLPADGRAMEVTALLERLSLNTVCESASCPNRADCYSQGVATFMILGDTCTRRCSFCGVSQGEPNPVDKDEPRRIVEAVRLLGLEHVVVTSVTRDDLPDGGAQHFAEVTRKLRRLPVTIELLIPDFCGSRDALGLILSEKPHIINHNIETVPRLYSQVRPRASYKRSLGLLRDAKETGGAFTKSGLMLGLGEEAGEVRDVLEELREAECDIVTIGQYLRPSPDKREVAAYISPEEFSRYREYAISLGFLGAASGPLVRSSHRAGRLFKEVLDAS